VPNLRDTRRRSRPLAVTLNAVDTVLRYSPDGLSKTVYRSRRAWSRKRRTARERRGDFSRSHTSIFGLEEFLGGYLGERAGVFIEAGAADGVFQSNTYWLERRLHWTGVLIEPVPELAREASLSRPASKVVQCALVSDDFDRETISVQYAGAMTYVSGLSRDTPRVPDGRNRSIVVPARTLTSVLHEVGVGTVDFLSLDVEGYEGPALRGLDLDEIRPRFMLIEVGEDEARRPQVEEIIRGLYEVVAKPSPLDLFYRLRAGQR
jgi:FkbM family methyltransferase